MKVAVPSNDGKIVSAHFGRSLGFKIFEIDNGLIISDTYLTNDFTGHSQGLHQEHNHSEGHGHSKGHAGGHHHSHQGIFNALDGVTTVIAGGMGRGLYDEFAERNIQVFVTSEVSIATAVNQFLKNELKSNPDICCSH